MLTALLPTLILAGTLGPVPGPQESRLVEADARFARELAARFSYVDLAEEVISGIDRAGLAREDVARLELLECDIYAAGARSEPVAAKRLELYDKALQRYAAFLEANASGTILPEAQRSYVNLVNDYGRSLEVELDTAIGADAAAIRDRMRRVIKGGIDLTGDLVGGSSASLSEAQKQERWRLMLARGRMLLTLARVSETGIYLFGQAERTLENLALEAGETSGPGLNAYLTLAEVKAAQSDYSSARDFADFVYGVALPEGETQQAEYGWAEATRDEKAGRFGLAELVLPTLIDARVALGETEQASRAALHFHNTWKREGFELSPRGYLALLSVARLLLDVGGSVAGVPEKGDLTWFDSEESATTAGHSAEKGLRSGLELALALAQQVNADNKGNTLQVRAQRVISDVISRPGISVSPDLLFEAAQGEYFAKEYAKAIESLKGVLRVLGSKERAVQEATTPKVLYFLGSALVGMERHLEAAMAFREGTTRWKGDPEYREKLARGFYAGMGVLRNETGNDPLFAKLYLEAETLLSDAAASTSDRGQILLQQAERKYREEKDYAGARGLYRQIEAGSDAYEKGQAMAALCLYKQGDFEGAKREFQSYLELVADPAKRPTGGGARAAREEAHAIATFYLGRIAYEASDWPSVIERLGSFDRDFPGQSDYGPNALYMVALAHVAQGDVTTAMSVVDRMRETFATHAKTGAAAIQVFQALKAEQEEATKAGDAKRADELRGKMAEYLRASNQIAETPKFQNLRSEATLWIELGRPHEAEATLRRTLTLFQSDAQSERDVQRYVLPDLGAVLLAQKRVPEAFQVLEPLVPAEPVEGRKPSASVVRSWCRTVTGWVEDEGGTRLVEVPGVGGPENFPRAAEYLSQLLAAEKQSGAGDWTCPWYELTFELAYANYQWARIDGTKREAAQRIVQSLVDFLGDEKLADVAEKCGDDGLQRRFNWLSGKVR
jgi:tetratricopeptide (TPR) repeat protein